MAGEWLEMSEAGARKLAGAIRFSRYGALLARLGVARLTSALVRLGATGLARSSVSLLTGIQDVEKKPGPGEYEVVYGIISQSRRKLILPFFSRVNLKNASSNLTSIGYRVSITKIGANPEY